MAKIRRLSKKCIGRQNGQLCPKNRISAGFSGKISEPGMNPPLVEENRQSSIEFDEVRASSFQSGSSWQTKMIASGDFTQRIEFMGEFSQSFNAMVTQLDQTLKELVRDETELCQVNEHLVKEINIRKKTEEALREREKRR